MAGAVLDDRQEVLMQRTPWSERLQRLDDRRGPCLHAVDLEAPVVEPVHAILIGLTAYLRQQSIQGCPAGLHVGQQLQRLRALVSLHRPPLQACGTASLQYHHALADRPACQRSLEIERDEVAGIPHGVQSDAAHPFYENVDGRVVMTEEAELRLHAPQHL